MCVAAHNSVFFTRNFISLCPLFFFEWWPGRVNDKRNNQTEKSEITKVKLAKKSHTVHLLCHSPSIIQKHNEFGCHICVDPIAITRNSTQYKSNQWWVHELFQQRKWCTYNFRAYTQRTNKRNKRNDWKKASVSERLLCACVCLWQGGRIGVRGRWMTCHEALPVL